MEGDLHPAHVGHACIDCHEGNSHQVWRMSSAVDLTCWACHGTEHDLTADTRPPNAVCSECHQGSHADQQALLLGILASGEAVEPAAKFMMGITCGSCHPAGAEESRPTQVVLEEACTMCHGPRHATVLRWWTDGMDARLADTRRYLENAERAAGDERGERLLRARESFDVVAGGGAIHNPILAHRLMAEVAEDARSTYVARGALPPGPPYLGAAPELGTCSGCHYDLRMEATGSRFPMTDAFHREVLGRWAGR
jgi:hypothetical protein